MTWKILIILQLLTFIVLLGCKKKVVDVNKDFIGIWYNAAKFEGSGVSTGYKSIEIKDNSAGEYSDFGEFGNTNFTGKARIKGSVLKIGVKKFKIDSEPKLIGNLGNIWTMTISGEAYYTNRDSQDGIGVYCFNEQLTVINTGTAVIQAQMDGQPVNLLPNATIKSDITCVGCQSLYTDNRGNNFSFYNIGCINTLQVQ